jgi:hypothetical protein
MNEVVATDSIGIILRLFEAHGPLVAFIGIWILKEMGFFAKFRRNNKNNSNNPHALAKILATEYSKDKEEQATLNMYWKKELERQNGLLEHIDEEVMKFNYKISKIRDATRDLVGHHNIKNPNEKITISDL